MVELTIEEIKELDGKVLNDAEYTALYLSPNVESIVNMGYFATRKKICRYLITLVNGDTLVIYA